MNTDSNQSIMKLNFKVAGNDFSGAGEASSRIKTVLRQIGIRPEIVRRAAIALYEAEMNMVIHASGGDIDVEITPQYMRAVFADQGPGIDDIEAAMQEGYSTAPDSIREMGFGAGMGLPNIKRCSDVVNITSDRDRGTTVEVFILLE